MALDASHIDLLVPLLVLGGIAGGTVLAMLPPQDQQLAGEALVIDLRLTLYGVVVSAVLVLFIYSRLNRLPFRALLDAFALPTMAAVAVQRVGCFFAGCCWGDLAILPGGLAEISGEELGRQMQTLPWLAGDWVFWAVQYGPGTHAYEQQLAAGLIQSDVPLSLPVHPVQLYEVGVLLVAYLLLRRTGFGENRPGTIAAAVALTYALVRFFIEYLRADGMLFLANLTIVQLQSVVLAMLSLLTTFYLLRRAAGARYAN